MGLACRGPFRRCASSLRTLPGHPIILVRIPVAAALAAALLAPAAPTSGQPASMTAPGASMTPAERHDWERSHRTSKIIGAEVRTRAGDKIGDIRDLVVDTHGSIRLALV